MVKVIAEGISMGNSPFLSFIFVGIALNFCCSGAILLPSCVGAAKRPLPGAEKSHQSIIFLKTQAQKIQNQKEEFLYAIAIFTLLSCSKKNTPKITRVV